LVLDVSGRFLQYPLGTQESSCESKKLCNITHDVRLVLQADAIIYSLESLCRRDLVRNNFLKMVFWGGGSPCYKVFTSIICLTAVVEWSKESRYLANKVDHYLVTRVRLQPPASPKKEN